MPWGMGPLFWLKTTGAGALGAAAYIAGVFSLLFPLAVAAAAPKVLRRRTNGTASPPVTILKPLKGLDSELYENLASFCSLDYPAFQLLFTVADADDAALPAVERLRAAFPDRDIEVVVSGRRIGLNPKVNNLSNAASRIKHDFLLMSDSDIRVPRDLLSRMMASLEDPRAGLVTAFYRSATRPGAWNLLESLSINAYFLPQAIVAAASGMKFAMGAAMLVRREAFERCGGFELMAEHLADDFILGEAVQACGYLLEFSDAVVESIPDARSASEHLRHQARWARTVRICRPAGYFGTILLQGFSLLTLKLALLGWDSRAAALALGILAAKSVSQVALRRLVEGRSSLAALWLLPTAEWVSFGAWLAGYGSNEILWRGQRYAVQNRGRLVPLARALEVPAVAEP